MLNKINSLKKLKVYILTAHSHNGLDWIHSLFDNHKDILIMPGFSLMRTISKFRIDINNMNNKQISESFSHIFFKVPGYKLQRRKFIDSQKKKNLFKVHFLKYLDNDNEKNIIKKIFYGIHYSYAELYQIIIDKKKVIISQEHVSWHCEEYEKLFSPKFIFVIRDFRAAFSGSLKGGTKVNGGLKTYANQFDKMLVNWILGTRFINKLKSQNKKKYYFIINEKFNKDLKKNMKKICLWLNISYKKTCLKQTFMGKEWFGESSYLTDGKKGTDINAYAPKNYYNIKNVERRWRNFLTQNEIKIFSTFFNYELVNFNYTNKKRNLFKYLISIMKINFIYLNQKKYFLNKYIILIRNIIKRFLIIHCPRLSIKIFKIY